MFNSNNNLQHPLQFKSLILSYKVLQHPKTKKKDKHSISQSFKKFKLSKDTLSLFSKLFILFPKLTQDFFHTPIDDISWVHRAQSDHHYILQLALSWLQVFDPQLADSIEFAFLDQRVTELHLVRLVQPSFLFSSLSH